MRRFAALVLVALAASGCATTPPAPSAPGDAPAAPGPSRASSEAPAPTPGATLVVERVHGEPLDAGPKPDPAACDTRLRSETAVAMAIRADLHVQAIATDQATIERVAKDPGASTKALGIPLTASEAAALQKDRGAGEPADAIQAWVNVGAANRFGGLWIDPPGSHSYVVAIVDGDPDTLALARCLERVETRYAWANLSIGEGRAHAQRIANDMQALRAQGVEINSVGYLENEGTVVVGVTHPSSELQTLFLARYGPPLRLEEEGPIIEY